MQTIADYFAAQLYGCKFCFEKFKVVYKMYEIKNKKKSAWTYNILLPCRTIKYKSPIGANR